MNLQNGKAAPRFSVVRVRAEGSSPRCVGTVWHKSAERIFLFAFRYEIRTGKLLRGCLVVSSIESPSGLGGRLLAEQREPMGYPKLRRGLRF